MQARSQGLDLTPRFESSMHDIAEKLKEGEVCKRNLVDTRKELDDCAGRAGDSNVATHLVGGAIGGAVLAFIIFSLTKR